MSCNLMVLSMPGERTQIAESAEFEGEHVNVIRRNAYFDFATANLLLSEVLEADPQMLITLTTPMTKLAINVTSTMENPPVVFVHRCVQSF